MPNDISGDVAEITATTESEAVRDDSQFSWGNLNEYLDKPAEPVAQGDAVELDKSLSETGDDQIPPAEELDESGQPKKSRSENFKTLKEEKANLEAQIAEKDGVLGEKDTEIEGFKTRLAEIDQLMEAHGGVEALEILAKNQEVFLDAGKYKEAVDYLESLPQISAIKNEFMNRTFGLGDVQLNEQQSALAEQNRLTVFNQTLKKEFGLSKSLPPETIGLALNWIVQNAEKDLDQLVENLKDELEFLQPQTPEQKKLAELEAKLNLQDKSKSPEKEEAPAFDPAEIHQKLDNFEQDVLTEQIAVVLKDYDTSFEKLSPVKQRAIKAMIRFELGASPVFIQLADYVLSNPDHQNAKFLKSQYSNAVRTASREIMSDFLGKPKPVSSQKPSSPTPSLSVSAKGKEPISPAPAPSKEEENIWGSIQKGKYAA